jgi:hypothetical protein
MIKKNVFAEWVARYHNDPVLFVKEVLGVDPDPWQERFLGAIARGDRKISVRSGHGVGKSTASSWAMLWYFMTRSPVKVVVTAPTSSQLYDAMFAELKRWINAMPAPLQSMSGHNAVTLLLGNPVRSSGFFYDTHTRLAGEWTTFQVACTDSPRVSDEYVKEMAMRYGEESNVYRIRVIGEFPKGDDDTVIPMDLLESALHRDVAASKSAPMVWGLDVARFGSDRSALCKRQGNVVTESIRTWKNLDLMQLTGAVVAEFNALAPSEQPREILVDSIGLGAGVVDRLRELGLPARGINVSESPAMGGTYRNLKAELWYKAKAWLEARDCKLANDPVLISELATVRYTFTSSGKIAIEGKDEIKKRGLPSPDKADAFVLTFASDAVAGMFGSAASSKWSQPLRRNLSRTA